MFSFKIIFHYTIKKQQNNRYLYEKSFERLHIIEEWDKSLMDGKVDETPDTLKGHNTLLPVFP